MFLVLAAQYESWSLPLAIILIVPMCLLAAIAGVWLVGMDNNIFTQIGLVVLIGLAAKNAILIVEFAKQLQDQGKARCEATVEACRLRLRPILMTSLRVHPRRGAAGAGQGAGAEMRVALGIAVFSGMLGVTALRHLLHAGLLLDGNVAWGARAGPSRSPPPQLIECCLASGMRATTVVTPLRSAKDRRAGLARRIATGVFLSRYQGILPPLPAPWNDDEGTVQGKGGQRAEIRGQRAGEGSEVRGRSEVRDQGTEVRGQRTGGAVKSVIRRVKLGVLARVRV